MSAELRLSLHGFTSKQHKNNTPSCRLLPKPHQRAGDAGGGQYVSQYVTLCVVTCERERKPLLLGLVHRQTQLSLLIRRDDKERAQTKTNNGAAVERLRWPMELVRGAVTSKKKGRGG